jgi:hypothetical protein
LFEATSARTVVCGVPTYYVSVTVRRPASLGDPALIGVFLEAAERAMCIPGEITVTGLVIEAEPVSIAVFETTLRGLLQERGAELESIIVRRI